MQVPIRRGTSWFTHVWFLEKGNETLCPLVDTIETQCEFPFEGKPKVSWGNGNICERMQTFCERTLKILGERKRFGRERNNFARKPNGSQGNANVL